MFCFVFNWRIIALQCGVGFCHQFSSVAQLCLTLCDPMDCSTPGFPIHHQLPKPAQTHIHCVVDAIQPSHPLSSPSPPAFNLSSGSFPTSRFFASGGQSIKSFSFSINPSNEYSGLISKQVGLGNRRNNEGTRGVGVGAGSSFVEEEGFGPTPPQPRPRPST